jgi:GAF domain-containing protein
MVEFNVPQLKDNLTQKLRQQLRSQAWLIKVNQTLVGVCLPIIEAIIVNMVTSSPNPFLFGLLFFIVIIHNDNLQSINRSWDPGEGYIGICFTTKSTRFSRDAAQDANTQPDNMRDEDKYYYRSLIAHPIKLRDNIKGVFVLTSSTPDQFDEDVHVPIVKTIAQILGAAMALKESC